MPLRGGLTQKILGRRRVQRYDATGRGDLTRSGQSHSFSQRGFENPMAWQVPKVSPRLLIQVDAHLNSPRSRRDPLCSAEKPAEVALI